MPWLATKVTLCVPTPTIPLQDDMQNHPNSSILVTPPPHWSICPCLLNLIQLSIQQPWPLLHRKGPTLPRSPPLPGSSLLSPDCLEVERCGPQMYVYALVVVCTMVDPYGKSTSRIYQDLAALDQLMQAG